MADAILDVQGLETQFKTSTGTVYAVNGVSLLPIKEAQSSFLW